MGRVFQPTNIVRDQNGNPVLDEHGEPVRRPRTKIWYIRYYDANGKAHDESSGSNKKGVAKALLTQREAARDRGERVGGLVGRITFDEAVKNVEHDYVTNQRRSASNVSTRIRLHLMPYFGGWRMSAITTADIRAYTTARLADHAQPASINRELAILKRAYSLAMKEGTLTSKPHIPMLEERNIRQGFFEADQLTAIQTHLPDCWRPVMTFAFYTGWRVRSEILPLTWAQVDERVQIVRLEAGTTKNTEGRTFPYGVLPNLLALLEAQAATRDALKAQGIICPWVFPDAQGRRLPAFYSKVWRQACREAGYPGKVPHDLRRSAVRNLVRAGVPEKTAMLLTGHKTRSVFDRYDIVNENDLRAAVTKLAAGSSTAPIQQPARVQQFRQSGS